MQTMNSAILPNTRPLSLRSRGEKPLFPPRGLRKLVNHIIGKKEEDGNTNIIMDTNERAIDDDGESSDKVKIIVEPSDANAIGGFVDGIVVKVVGEGTFRLCKELTDGAVLVCHDTICASIKNMFEEKRTILEPAGALLAAAEAYCIYHGLKGENIVAITSGANLNFDKLRVVNELTNVGSKQEAVLATVMSEVPGSFKQFCELVNGCTGKMGKAVIKAADSAGLLVPVSFVLAEESGQTVQVRGKKIHLHSHSERESILAYPKMVVVDYTVPAAVKENGEPYRKVSVPFIIGTSGGDRDRLYKTVDDIKVLESHQTGNLDISGTAKAIISRFQKLWCLSKWTSSRSDEDMTADSSRNRGNGDDIESGAVAVGENPSAEGDPKLPKMAKIYLILNAGKAAMYIMNPSSSSAKIEVVTYFTICCDALAVSTSLAAIYLRRMPKASGILEHTAGVFFALSFLSMMAKFFS